MALFVWVYISGTTVIDKSYTVEELGDSVKVQIAKMYDNRGVEVWGVIHASSDHVWKVIKDKDRFDKFLPYVKESKITEKNADHAIQKQVFDFPFGRMEMQHKIWSETKDAKRIFHWQQQQGPLHVNRGSWIVSGDDKKTLLQYKAMWDIPYMPKWMTDFYMKRKLVRIVESIRTRVADLEKNEPEYFKED